MPILMITPDITPETCAGATGCACGSQVWNGTNPALTANPERIRTSGQTLPS